MLSDLRHDAQPGAKLVPALELLEVGHPGRQRPGAYLADAVDLGRALGRRAASHLGAYLLVAPPHALVQTPPMFIRLLHGRAGQPGVTCVEHDNYDSAATYEVQPVPRTKVHPYLRDFAFDRLPVPEASRFCLPQAGRDADLGAFVLQGVEPRDELFGLADGELATTVAIWIQNVKGNVFGWRTAAVS